MNLIDPKITALQYNEFINSQNVEGLASLMPEDFIFVPISGNIEKGKESMVQGWRRFFEEYTDYRNIFTRVESRDNLVILIGYSTCSYDPLDGPSIWTATIVNDMVKDWCIYEDTEKNRNKLKIV
jgi:ketosteroid isomerase-like protein